MLWRKGNRHVWFTSGVNFAITKITKPKYPSVLVRIWFHFWFSAIDAKGLIKTAIDERSFHLRGARPAHVFHRWVQTLPIRYLPSTEKDTNNRKFISLWKSERDFLVRLICKIPYRLWNRPVTPCRINFKQFLASYIPVHFLHWYH